MMYIDVAVNTPVDSLFTYSVSDSYDSLIGKRVEIPFRSRKLIGFIVNTSLSQPGGDFAVKEIIRIIDEKPLFSAKELSLAQWVADRYFCSLGESLAAMLPGGKKEKEYLFPEDPESFEQFNKTISLAPQQKEALDIINNAGSAMVYLFGITGSGKTEVFLQAAEGMIAQGKGVIYLVPEIALTHQLMLLVTNRFPGNVAVLHSGLTPSQKLTEWSKIKNNEALFVIGARSAVFAPISDLGLVVIDEEHDSSYKSGSTPRYHARQVAMYRCAKEQAQLIMGSATPSLEAYYLMQKKIIIRVNLPQRLAGGKPPEIEVVNLEGSYDVFSPELIKKMEHTLTQGGQVILFLNRRGFSYFFHCRSCGYEFVCKHCSVGLTYHKSRDTMICHYCGFSAKPVELCPNCKSLDVGYSGFGTELIEESIAKIFPGKSVARIDTDAVSKKGIREKVLRDFFHRKIDILLGTQMVAKGLNFPGVKLVGIILADSSLLLPDFRADERTFALMVQVSGRSGRFSPDGEVLIQTFRPENKAVKCAAERKYEEYYQKELQVREMLGFPPFCRLFRFVIRSKNLLKCKKTAHYLANLFEEFNNPDIEILGPAECPILKISGNYRYQILIKTHHFKTTHHFIRHIIKKHRKTPGVYIETDVDPVSLL